jgi:inorganic triphosphatase YgiF
MVGERAIRLEIPAAAVNKVMRLPWLWELATGEVSSSRVAATYYDTEDLALRARGTVVRVQRADVVRSQTVLAAAGGGALPVERSEWSGDIANDGSAAADEDKVFRSAPRKLRKRLGPVFDVEIDRSAFPIRSANAAVEITIDRAHIAAGERNAAWCEIALDLQRGSRSELVRLARRIADEVPATLSLKSEADRGYALLEGAPPRVAFAEPIALSPEARIADAFRAVGFSCLRHFALNADAVAAGLPQGVHEMRVGLRRFRSAISLFERVLDGPETDAIKEELRWLAGELALAREIDVFIERALGPLSAGQDERAPVALHEDAVARRASALERAKAAVTSDRCRQLVVKTALWLTAAEWSDAVERERDRPFAPIGPFADKALSKRTRKIVEKLARFERLEDAKRHKLRKHVKSLRYAVEFLASVYPDEDRWRARHLKSLRTLQMHMGRLNDIVVHERLGAEFLREWTAPDAAAPAGAQRAFAMGLVVGRERLETAAHVAAVVREGRRLARLEPFWRT